MWPEAGEDALEVLKVFAGDDGVEPRPGVLENISVISLSLCTFVTSYELLFYYFFQANKRRETRETNPLQRKTGLFLTYPRNFEIEDRYERDER